MVLGGVPFLMTKVPLQGAAPRYTDRVDATASPLSRTLYLSFSVSHPLSTTLRVPRAPGCFFFFTTLESRAE